MRNRRMGLSLAILAALGLPQLIRAQTAGQPETKKTQLAVHTQDLAGVWANITEDGPTFNPKEAPSFQPWAEAKWKENRDNSTGKADILGGLVDKDPTVASCFPTGMPRLMTELLPFEIIQLHDRVLILFEKDYAVSHIWTDGRKLPEDPDPSYMGQSAGRWDGDTLVVNTIGLKDITWLDRTGHPHSDALRVEWRLHRVKHDILQIDWTFDDPKAFTKPWTGKSMYRYHPEWTLEEFISCEDRLLHGGLSPEQKAAKGQPQ